MKTKLFLGGVIAILLYVMFTHRCPKCEGYTVHTIDTVYIDTTHHLASVPPKKKGTVVIPIVDSASGYTDSVTASVFTACYDDSTVSICVDVPVLGNVVGDMKFNYQNKLGYVIHDNTNTYIPVQSSSKKLFLGATVSDIGSVAPQTSYLLGSKMITYQYDLRLRQHRVGLMWGVW